MARRRIIRPKGVIIAGRLQRTPAPGPRLAFRIDPWTRKLIRPMMITLLAISVAVGLLVIVRILSPDRTWMAVMPLCFLAALEGTYTTVWLNNPDSHGVDRAIYRVTEILFIVVLSRIYSWIIFGGGIPAPEEMRLFLTSPGAILAVGGFFTTVFVTLIAWWFAVLLSRIFTKLDISIYELDFYTLSPAEQKAKGDDRPIQVPREELLNQYITLWLSGGFLMILMTALSTFEVGQFATVANPLEITRLGLVPAMLFALLVYFLNGFWLLSHARLLRLNARWLMDGVAKEASFERSWQRRSLLVIGALALIALFLPIGSSLAISRILTIGLSGFVYLANILMTFLASFFAAVMAVLTQQADENGVQPTEIAPLPTPEPVIPPVIESNPLANAVISSAFWALIIAFIIASIMFFLRERGYHLDKVQLKGYWVLVTGWLREGWSRLTGRVLLIRHDIKGRLTVVSSTPLPKLDVPRVRPRFLRLNSLSPRDQVRYYYLALVRRAGEQGLKRPNSKTPLEYAQELKNTWPESDHELEELTDAFIEARYSPQPIEKEEANLVRELWQTLKLRLRSRK